MLDCKENVTLRRVILGTSAGVDKAELREICLKVNVTLEVS